MTEHTLGVCLADGADLAQPVALGDGGDAIAGLVDAHVARVAEYHIVSVFTLSLCASGGRGRVTRNTSSDVKCTKYRRTMA